MVFAGAIAIGVIMVLGPTMVKYVIISALVGTAMACNAKDDIKSRSPTALGLA
jgi:hypothetical protein